MTLRKTGMRLAGGLLAAASLAWVAWRFERTGVWQRLHDSAYTGALVKWSLLAAPVYMLGTCLLGLAWWSLQSAFVARRLPLRPMFAIYAVTQFGKYLPGSLGQYLGRYVWLRRYDLSPAAVVLATFGEAGFLLLAALIWAAQHLRQLWPWLPFALPPWTVAGAEIALLCAGVAGLQALRARSPRLRERIPLAAPGRLVWVLPLQTLFFAVMAATVMLPARMLPISTEDLWRLPSVASASWIVGFLALGTTPGGLGVRELAFVMLMRGHIAEADALVLAAAFRLSTIAGDALFLLLGLALRGRRGGRDG